MWSKLVNGIGTRRSTFCFPGRRNLLLYVSIPSCLGQHRLIAIASDAVGGQNASSESGSVPRSFRRIRMATQEDFFACYAIMAGYINHPEAAYSVEECIVDSPSQGHYPFGDLLGGTPTETVTVDDVVRRSIDEYLRSLCLGEETTRQMSEALDLKKPELTGEKPHYDFNLTVATLLISLCPNITVLRIYGVDSSTPLGQFLLKNNYGKLDKPSLQKLKEIQLHPVNCMDERQYQDLRSLNYVRYFHRLPAVKFLSLEGLEDYQSDVTFFPPKSSPSITKVNISHAHMPDEMIGTIIRIPKTLEELSISNRGLQTLEGNWPVDAETLAECLLEHKDCLRELDLDVAVDQPYNSAVDEVDELEEMERDDERSKWYFIQDQKDGDSGLPLGLEDLPTTREYPARSIGSLHDFKSLTRLSIRIGLILGYDDTKAYCTHVISVNGRVISGWDDSITYGTTHVPSASYRLVDALPPNLEFLRLYGYKKGEVDVIDDHVRELLEKKADRFPKLREIEGVDEFLPGVPGTYGADPDDEHLWVRSKENLHWVEA